MHIANVIMVYLFIFAIDLLFVHLFCESLEAKNIYVSSSKRFALATVILLAFVLQSGFILG